jgi:tetratricopeptide (TPR) repeat protein
MSFRPILAFVLATTCVGVACTDSEVAKRQHLQNGDRFAAEAKYNEAAIEYRNALARDDKFGEARKKLAVVYERLNRPDQAYAEIVRAADLLPNDMDVQLDAAKYLFIAKQFLDARQRAELVLAREPKNVDALVLRGNILAGLRDMPSALDDIEAAIQIDPEHGLHHTNLALLQLAQGRVAPARESFEKAIEVEPRSIPARVALANFYWATGDLKGAESSLRAALAIEPESLLLNRVAAAFYMSANRLKELEPHLKLLAEKSKTNQAKFTLADFYLMANRREEAKAILKTLASDSNTASRAQTRLAQLDYAEGRRAEAHASVDRILTRQPNQAAPLRARAGWLQREGKPREALENARAAVAVDARSITGLYLLGTLQIENRLLDEAIKTFNDILRLNPSATAAHLQLGRLYMARGQAITAVTVAQQLIRSAPELPAAHALLGQALRRIGDYVGAESEAKRLLAQQPSSYEARVILGELAVARGQHAEARQQFSKAFETNATAVDALQGLTTVDLLEGKAASAIERVEKRLASDPTDIGLLTLSARAYAASGDAAMAEKRLRAVLAQEPGNPRAYSLLAQLMVVQNRIEDARKEYEGLARLNPRNLAAQTLVGVMLEAQGRLPEAITQYEETLRLDPTAAVAANNLAWLYARDDVKLESALRLVQIAAKELPDNPEVQDTLGWIYYRQKKAPQAISAFEFAVGRDPDQATYRYHLALALVQDDQQEKARPHAEAAVRLQPNFGDAQKLLRSLPQRGGKG